MTELEKLNERIAQLTDLVKSGEETISATKEMLKLAEQERDRLADQRCESEPKFERVHQTKPYWRLAFDNAFGCGAWTLKQVERGWYDFNNMTDFEGNNYFHTEQRAKEVADKINLLLKLERLHDTFCPNYMPDFNDEDATKWYLFVSVRDKKWHWEICHACVNDVLVYFSSAEIAQKVCDILNAELKEENEGNCNE